MKPHPVLAGIRHVALRVRNIAMMREFYTGKLGFQVEWEPDSKNVYLTTGSDNLALHEAQDPIAAGGSLDHIGLLVDQPDHVDEWAEYLRDSGVKLAQEPKTHRAGARSIYFNDPEGNRIQLIFHPPISGK